VPTNINYRFPLNKGIAGYFDFNQSVESATKENLKNLLLTRKGERVIFKDYGTSIYNMLFEIKTIEMKNKIKIEIIEQVRKYVPTAKINVVNALFKEDISQLSQFSKIPMDENSVLIVINYSIVTNGGNLILPNNNFGIILKNQ
jgi:phage baseplate assembly protein W